MSRNNLVIAALLLVLSTSVFAEDKADIFHGTKAFHYTVENGTELFVNSESGKTGLVVFCDKPESLRAAIVVNVSVDLDREKPPITVKTNNGKQGFETSVRDLSDGRKLLLIDPDNMRMVHFKSLRFIDAVANQTNINIDMNLVEDGLYESFEFSEYQGGVSIVASECGYTPQ